jgi:uncharacterized protein (DUF2235 family)
MIMAKNIVLCADGTWNGPEEQTGKSVADTDDNAGELNGDTVTNVVKYFANLAGRTTPETMLLRNEQEKIATNSAGTVVQIAKYLHGVGDSNNLAIKLLGGVFGVGVIARIVRGYTFISRYYQPGDSIHIVGFSRGAYTARALAGMICRIGLLDPKRYNVNDKQEAYRRGVAAWNLSKGMTLSGSSGVTAIANRLLGFLESFVVRATLNDQDFVKNVPVKSVAVWDTVGSMGVPVYLHDERYDVFRFADTVLSDKVQHGFHAMAIDELRMDFPVTKWDRRAGIEQLWFVGAHADVGGGYAESESRLSDTALKWLIAKTAAVGVTMATPLTRVPNGMTTGQKIHAPWDSVPFKLLPQSPRQPGIEDTFHSSVVERWKQDAAYRPKALAFISAQNVGRLAIQA